MNTIKDYPKFKVASEGSFAILRTYSVENECGFVCGSHRQYVIPSANDLSSIRPASFSKVEAERFVFRINRTIESFEKDKRQVTDGDVQIMMEALN